jgi:hypothetical protein
LMSPRTSTILPDLLMVFSGRRARKDAKEACACAEDEAPLGLADGDEDDAATPLSAGGSGDGERSTILPSSSLVPLSANGCKLATPSG